MHSGHPVFSFPVLELAVALHEWSEFVTQRHQYFLPDPNVTSFGVSGVFLYRSNSCAISGKRVARELVTETRFPLQNPHCG